MPLTVVDDRHRELRFTAPPKRIVSLVPSDTYSVAMLGGETALVGRTDYCLLPEEVAARVPSVGGTKNPRLDDIRALSPDLVIANQEENSRGDLEQLAASGVRVLIVFPKRVADGLSGLARLARILGTEATTSVRELIRRGYANAKALEAARGTSRTVRVFCPIWMNPLMTIHGSTFISDMLQVAGGENVFAERVRRYPLAADHGIAPAWADTRVGDRDVRYPRVTEEELVASDPELILLPDEPHPFNAEDAAWFRKLDVSAAHTGNVLHVSGKDLCWYGAWTVDALPRMKSLLDGVRHGRVA